MSNLFKKVRIIHSPEEKRYYLEQKPCFGFVWKRIDTFEYVDKLGMNPHGCHDLAQEAFAKAERKAEMLLARTVVWEKSNYMWG